MRNPGERLAAAARDLVGTPFRLHGRDPAAGLDCLGVLTCAFAASGRTLLLPATYGLRNTDIAQWLAASDRADVVEATGAVRPGDILLVQPATLQHHVGVAGSATTIIHAHAGLRRVVETPLPLPWPTLRHWRLKD